RLGARQPLCGIGVTSRIVRITIPCACNWRIADSRPEPGPFTNTSTLDTPWSLAAMAAFSEAWPAANGVLLREPLKPATPALAHEIVFPTGSVIVTIVLLNVACTCTIAWLIFLRTFFLAPLAAVFLPIGSGLLQEWTGGNAGPGRMVSDASRPRAPWLRGVGLTSWSCRPCGAAPCACGSWSASAGRGPAGR